jgi:hypothetical protein
LASFPVDSRFRYQIHFAMAQPIQVTAETIWR